jgi:hypothetical protein
LEHGKQLAMVQRVGCEDAFAGSEEFWHVL